MLDGNKLRKKIKSSHYRTYKSFAEALGITPQGFRYMCDNGSTTEARYLQICDLLEIEPSEIASENWKNKLIEKEMSDMDTGISSRLEEIMKEKGLGVNAFAESISVAPSTISTIVTRDNCKLNFVQKVLVSHKDISPAWLVMGYGKLYASDAEKMISDESYSKNENNTLRDELDNCRETVKNLNKLIREQNGD